MQLEELERQAAARPACVNSWRRLAEFLFFFVAARTRAADAAAVGGAVHRAGGPLVDDSDAVMRPSRAGSRAGSEADGGGGARAGPGRVADAVSRWLGLDPVSRPGLSMLAALERAGLAERGLAVRLLGDALDYGPDPALQRALLRLTEPAASAVAGGGSEGAVLAEAAWGDRREWWPAVHGADFCRRLWGA